MSEERPDNHLTTCAGCSKKRLGNAHVDIPLPRGWRSICLTCNAEARMNQTRLDGFLKRRALRIEGALREVGGKSSPTSDVEE